MVSDLLDRKARHWDANKDTTTSCAICLDEFDEKDEREIAELNCNNKHIFHLECIKNWSKTNDICPMCREPIIKGT